MSQKTLNLCLERYNFVKFGETTKSSHTVLCINNANNANSGKYRLTSTELASKHGEGFVFTLNYDFDRPLFTIVQKSYALDGTSGNIVFEGIDPISKDGSKYLRKVTVAPVKLSDSSYLLEVTNDEYLRIGTTGAALGDEGLASLNEKIVTAGGIEKSVETVGGKHVLKLDAGGPQGAKEIVYFDIDPTDPPSGLYDSITVTLSNDKEPVIRIDDAVYFYTATGTDKYVFIGGYKKEAVGYTEITVSDDDSVTSKSVDDKVFNMYMLDKTDPVSPGDPPGDEDYWICDADKHVITKNELLAAHADCRYFILNNDIEPDLNSRKYFASVTVITDISVRLQFYMMERSDASVAVFFQKVVTCDSEGRLYVLSDYSAHLAEMDQAVLVSEPQSFDSTQKAQGRDNIGAASASDVTALQTQVSSLSNVSAYSVKGEATVAQLNAGPSGIQAGWAYQLTDSGTLTEGTLAVVAGDTVAWDGTKWFPLVKSDYYATKTYAQNVAHSIAPEFDPTRDEDHKYLVDEVVIKDGKQYLCVYPHYGAWDDSHFKERLVSKIYPNGTDIEVQHPDDSSFVKIIHGSDLIRGRNGSTGYSDHTTQATTKNFIPVKKDDIVVYAFKEGKTDVSTNVVFYDSEKNYLYTTDWSGAHNNGITPGDIVVQNDGFVKFNFTTGGTITTQSDLDYFDCSMVIVRFGVPQYFGQSLVHKLSSIIGNSSEIVLTQDFFEQGAWDYSTDHYVKIGSSYRVRAAFEVKVEVGDIVSVNDPEFEIVCGVSGSDGTRVQSLTARRSHYMSYAGMAHITFRHKEGASISTTPADAAGKVVIRRAVQNKEDIYVSDVNKIMFGNYTANGVISDNSNRIVNYVPIPVNKGDVLIVNNTDMEVSVREVDATTQERLVSPTPYFTTIRYMNGIKYGSYVVQNNNAFLELVAAPVSGSSFTSSDIKDYADCFKVFRLSNQSYQDREFFTKTPKSSRKGKPINVTVQYQQDGAFVGDKLWVSNDDYGSDTSIKVIDVENETIEKTITHDFGHNGIADYCEETDTLLNVIPGDDKIYLLPNASAVTTSIAKADCIQIDLYTLFGIRGSGNCGCFGENKQTLYIGKGYQLVTNTTINEIYKLWLEVDANGDYTGNATLLGTYKLNAIGGVVNGIQGSFGGSELNSMQSIKYDGYVYMAYGTSGHNFFVVDLDDETMTWRIVGRLEYKYYKADHTLVNLEPEFVALRNGKIVCGSRHIDTNNHANDISSIVEFDKW